MNPAEMNPAEVPWLCSLREWPSAALAALADTPAVVRVLVAQVRGSAPREAGVSMLVSAQAVVGTIGGGQLEWQAIHTARALLARAQPGAQLQRLVLGTDLGQCCGGVVEVWVERLTASDRPWLERAALCAAGDQPMLLQSTLGTGGLTRTLVAAGDSNGVPGPAALPSAPQLTRCADGQVALLERLDGALPALWLFGAGYVGQALARLLMDLPVRLTWVDSRPELFPTRLPGPVRVLAGDPLGSLACMPAGAHCLIMTHSHSLDFALTHALLRRGDFGWLGLIGSKSKAARFRSRLVREGVSAERLARLVCPIGTGGITSKWPAAIAISIAAQLLQQLSPTAGATRTAAADCTGSDCARCGSRA